MRNYGFVRNIHFIVIIKVNINVLEVYTITILSRKIEVSVLKREASIFQGLGEKKSGKEIKN